MDANKIKVFFKSYFDKFKPQPCPFCGDKCITFNMKNQCMNWQKNIKCPKCGVIILLGDNYRKWATFSAIITLFLFLIFSFRLKLLFIILLLVLLCFIFTPYADLDWEEERSWPPTLPSIIAQEKRDAEKQRLKEAKLAEKLAKKATRRNRQG